MRYHQWESFHWSNDNSMIYTVAVTCWFVYVGVTSEINLQYATSPEWTSVAIDFFFPAMNRLYIQ